MSSLTVWPCASAASRYLVDSPTNSCSPMAYEWTLPPQSRSPGPDERERLQRRMPPRSRIKSIIDRSRTDLDPWLDDEHD
jgi:hypothetical protein